MKVNCLAHVFHLSAYVLLAWIKIEKDMSDCEDYDEDSYSEALVNNRAYLGTIAETVMKVILYALSAINICYLYS